MSTSIMQSLPAHPTSRTCPLEQRSDAGRCLVYPGDQLASTVWVAPADFKSLDNLTPLPPASRAASLENLILSQPQIVWPLSPALPRHHCTAVILAWGKLKSLQKAFWIGVLWTDLTTLDKAAMRYQNWDVLLFPGEGSDSKIPLQEFRTACDVVQDANSSPIAINDLSPAYFRVVTHPLPTVSCFVPTLPPGTPFKVSVHCWTVPEASKATLSLVSRGLKLAFQAHVILDGNCVSSLLAAADSTWPQVISGRDQTVAGKKAGGSAPLLFPAFHDGMLNQVLREPGQSYGRIKIIIAEGVAGENSGQPFFTPTRNMMAFSFQHTPLYILEEAGVAWPNPGMFFQADQQSYNSPPSRKPQEVDPDAHAHSPHRGSHYAFENRHGGGYVMSNSLEARQLMPPPFLAPATFTFGDPTLPQYDQIRHDPFFEHRHFHDLPSRPARQPSSSGDVSMADRPPLSSSEHDQSMPDYSRPLSPVSSFKSLTMPEFSRPTSPLSQRSRSDAIALSVLPSTPAESRQVSKESLRGPNMQRLMDEAIGVDPEPMRDELARRSSETSETVSPRRLLTSEAPKPNGIRTASKENSPLVTNTRPSAAAQARASSYAGKARTLSNITNTTRVNSRQSPVPNQRVPSDKHTPSPESSSGVNVKSHKAAAKTPSVVVKGRKEGKASEASSETGQNLGRTLPSQRQSSQDDEEEISKGIPKRRRVSESTSLNQQILVEGSRGFGSPSKRKSDSTVILRTPQRNGEDEKGASATKATGVQDA